MSSEIKHQGVIRGETDTDYLVHYERSAACEGCNAKKYCNLNMDEQDLLPIPKSQCRNHQIGDVVTISISEKNAWKALLYGYVLPFFVLMAGIFIPFLCKLPQGWAGIIGIGSVILYYLIFGLFRNKIDKQFVFRIE